MICQWHGSISSSVKKFGLWPHQTDHSESFCIMGSRELPLFLSHCVVWCVCDIKVKNPLIYPPSACRLEKNVRVIFGSRVFLFDETTRPTPAPARLIRKLSRGLPVQSDLILKKVFFSFGFEENSGRKTMWRHAKKSNRPN